jgi:hypothetical protein
MRKTFKQGVKVDEKVDGRYKTSDAFSGAIERPKLFNGFHQRPMEETFAQIARRVADVEPVEESVDRVRRRSACWLASAAAALAAVVVLGEDVGEY